MEVDVVADVQGHVVIVDGVMVVPVPAGVTVMQIGFAHEFAVGDVDETVRNGDADLHVLDFVTPLIFVGPPDAGTIVFAGRNHPGTAGGILAEGDAAEAAGAYWESFVVEDDGVVAALAQRGRKIDKDGAVVARVAERRGTEEDTVDLEVRIKIKLNSGAVLEHAEADGIAAGDEFPGRIDANAEVVIKQIVVAAVGAVGAAQDVGVGRRCGCLAGGGSYGLPPILRTELERSGRKQKQDEMRPFADGDRLHDASLSHAISGRFAPLAALLESV